MFPKPHFIPELQKKKLSKLNDLDHLKIAKFMRQFIHNKVHVKFSEYFTHFSKYLLFTAHHTSENDFVSHVKSLTIQLLIKLVGFKSRSGTPTFTRKFTVTEFNKF